MHFFIIIVIILSYFRKYDFYSFINTHKTQERKKIINEKKFKKININKLYDEFFNF